MTAIIMILIIAIAILIKLIVIIIMILPASTLGAKVDSINLGGQG